MIQNNNGAATHTTSSEHLVAGSIVTTSAAGVQMNRLSTNQQPQIPVAGGNSVGDNSGPVRHHGQLSIVTGGHPQPLPVFNPGGISNSATGQTAGSLGIGGIRSCTQVGGASASGGLVSPTISGHPTPFSATSHQGLPHQTPQPTPSSQLLHGHHTPTSSDACASIVHSLMCHRQVCIFYLIIFPDLLKILFLGR